MAYNAANTLEAVLHRIPMSFRPRVTEVLVCDDHSQDSTYEVAKAHQIGSDLPITVVRNRKNLGYGGNQKVAYQLAIKHGIDIVVLLHGDGQYAPELLPEIVAPLERGECDAVMGSRMMIRGAARAGGMPLYKFVGNRILTGFQNRMLASQLSEFHSGYRAYRTEALAALPLEQNDDGFCFDTQIIIQLYHQGKQIKEIPIPTYYGNEICYVNGLRYAWEVSAEVLRYRLHTMGLGVYPRCLDKEVEAIGAYELKTSDDSSHGRILARLLDLPPGKVLDLGCSSGLLAEQIRKMGHHVVGVDIDELEGVRDRTDEFVVADLDQGIPEEVGNDFDAIVAGDVIEHLRRPSVLLRGALSRLGPSGILIACVPNFGHWYPRLRTSIGRFDYDRRGILDEGHLRFFTRRSFERLLARTGWVIERFEPSSLPLDVVAPGNKGRLLRTVSSVEHVAVHAWPELFAYQFVYQLIPRAETSSIAQE